MAGKSAPASLKAAVVIWHHIVAWFSVRKARRIQRNLNKAIDRWLYEQG